MFVAIASESEKKQVGTTALGAGAPGYLIRTNLVKSRPLFRSAKRFWRSAVIFMLLWGGIRVTRPKLSSLLNILSICPEGLIPHGPFGQEFHAS
jgi:hypothetical protein